MLDVEDFHREAGTKAAAKGETAELGRPEAPHMEEQKKIDG